MKWSITNPGIAARWSGNPISRSAQYRAFAKDPAYVALIDGIVAETDAKPKPPPRDTAALTRHKRQSGEDGMTETTPERKPLGLRRTLVWLYEGVGKWPVTFRWAVLIFDILTIGYFLVSPFIPKEGYHFWLDYVIGGIIALDLLARFYIAPTKRRFFQRFMNIADLIVVFTMFAPLISQNYAFLRIIRALRIARAFTFLRDNSPLSRYFHLHRVVIERGINVVVFLFIMSALVYADQVNKPGSDVHNYLDAFYFTVTSLTTTGYGDITLVGWTGRVLPIIIMLLGVTLFLRLLRALVTPSDKAEVECTNCGLYRHDRDAVHCKHCGEVVYIENEGFDP